MTTTHNLGDVLDAHTQEAMESGVNRSQAHGPIWTREELDFESNARHWRLMMKEIDNASKRDPNIKRDADRRHYLKKKAAARP